MSANQFDADMTPSQEAIVHYIEAERHSGALLVTGKWGSGKTHWLKLLKNNYNSKKKSNSDVAYAFAFISLFGIDSVESLEEKVKKEICYSFASPKSGKQDKEITSKLFRGLKTLTGLFSENNQVVAAIDTALNLNYLDFIDLAPTILGKRIVLVFDDLERADIDIKTLLGVINNYCENIGLRVVIVADEEYIAEKEDDSDKDYREFKEKVISQTIHIELNYKQIIAQLIKEYKSEGSNYQRFLNDHIETIVAVFENSTYYNLRSIKSVINGFDKIFDVFMDITNYKDNSKFVSFEEKAILFVLSQYVAFTLESHRGNKIYSALFESTDEIIESSSDTAPSEDDTIMIPFEKPDYTYKYEESIFDEYRTSQSLVQWIENGIYNQGQLTIDLRALLEAFKPQQKSIIEIFLSSHIMSMEWTTFIDGYKETLREAYDGNLSSEQLLDFIVKIYKAKQLGLPIGAEQECDEPNYTRMESAYRQRNKSKEQEPLLGGADGPVEETAKTLRLLIKTTISNRLIDQRCNEYYNKCLSFFNSPETSNSPCMSLSDSIQICFDNDMMESIFLAYKKSTNSTRMKIERVFSNIRFTEYRTNQIAPILIQKLEGLNSTNELDPIGRANLQEFISSIKEKFGICDIGTVV